MTFSVVVGALAILLSAAVAWVILATQRRLRQRRQKAAARELGSRVEWTKFMRQIGPRARGHRLISPSLNAEDKANGETTPTA